MPFLLFLNLKNWFLNKKNIFKNCVKSIICERFFKYHYLKPVINGKKLNYNERPWSLYGKSEFNCACDYCGSLFLVPKKTFLITKGIYKI